MKTTFKRGVRPSRANGTRVRLNDRPLTVDAKSPAIAATSTRVEDIVPTSYDDRSHDILQLYLTEIGQIKLLTPAEELALARKVKRGDKQARETMIKANLRLVVKIARDYEGLGVPLLDLINEGNLGLMKGVERFDPKKGAKLSTYSSWWIRQSILRALAYQSKTIRLPVHVTEKMSALRKAEVKLRELYDREPTDEELAEEVQMSPRRIAQYRQATKSTVSLDAPLGEDETSRVSEVVADPNVVLPADKLIENTDLELVREILETLPKRERAILTHRFGLGNDRSETLEQVGQRFGVTRERVRQIQEVALRKMRIAMEKRELAIAA